MKDAIEEAWKFITETENEWRKKQEEAIFRAFSEYFAGMGKIVEEIREFYGQGERGKPEKAGDNPGDHAHNE